MANAQQLSDGSWVPAEPLGWQEEHNALGRFIFWLRRIEHCNDDEGTQRCLPWKHDWDVRRHLTVPLFDPSSRGELWRCRKCPKVRAR